MNATIGYIEDDDLAMFALGLLTAPEAAAVARAVTEDEGTRVRLAEVRAQLGAYIESTVVLDEVPEQSLDRLMGRIAEEKRVVPFRAREAAAAPMFGMTAAASAEDVPGRRSGVGRVLPWVGWAAAAGLAVTAGTLYRERTGLEAQLSAESGQVAQVSNETAEAAREREVLRARSAEQSRKVDELAAAQVSAQDAAAKAKRNEQQAAGQTEAARAEVARVQATGAATAEQAQARVSELTAQLAETQRQQAVLEGQVHSETATVATQAGELERMRTEAVSAREVLEALTDRTALRVTLTKPKGTPEPTGRTTYVASRGTLVFQGSNLTALAANKVYQLWLLPADGGAPVSAGTFSPDARGNATLVTAKLAGAVPAKAFAITVENDGGAVAPTMPILLVGAAG